MINGDLNEFMEILSYGQDLYFVYNSERFFVQGWFKDGKGYMFLQKDDPYCEGYIWKCCDVSIGECSKKFLSAPIFNNKSFLEIEKDVEWVD